MKLTLFSFSCNNFNLAFRCFFFLFCSGYNCMDHTGKNKNKINMLNIFNIFKDQSTHS